MMMQKHWKLHFTAIGFAVLILDSKTVSLGASEGITLCLTTVIPSLFPFIFMSSMLVNALNRTPPKFLSGFEQIFSLAPGTGSYFITGILGGYPTGAAAVAEGYRRGQINRLQAEHLLSFCNNAGPAFLFGVAGSLFSKSHSFILWLIHILSALLTGVLLPKPAVTDAGKPQESADLSFSAGLLHSVRSMGTVCGWIILFRIVITFCERWFLWIFPEIIHVAFCGILELANGCCSLGLLSSQPTRFLLFSGFLAFGGICVTMQTQTVTTPLSIRRYITGKNIQCLISLMLSGMLAPSLFPAESIPPFVFYLISGSALFLVASFLLFFKKTVAFPGTMIYTKEKPAKG